MPRHPHGVRSGAPVSVPPTEVLGQLGDGNNGGWAPLQYPVWHDTGLTDISHDIQRGGRHGNMALVFCGDTNGGGIGSRNRGVSTENPMDDGIFLCW